MNDERGLAPKAAGVKTADVAAGSPNRCAQGPVCSSIGMQLGYNKLQQLVRMQTDMNPYHMLKLPMFAYELDWAK